MSLGRNIATMRKSMKLIQEQLAEKCDVSRQAVTKWESGESEPSIAKLVKLSEAFAVSIDDLITGNNINAVCNKSKEIVLQYRDLSMLAYDLIQNQRMFFRKPVMILYAELIYNVIKTRYMNSNDEIFDEYLIKNTSSEERKEKVKLLIDGAKVSNEPLQDYVNGKCEIDVAFEKIYENLEVEYAKESKIEDMKRESQSAKKYHKVRRLLNKMCMFEDYNENKLKDIDNELQNTILEQDKQTQFGRGLLLYLKEIEIAWNNKDLRMLEKLKEDGDELQGYIWETIKVDE